MMIFAGSLQLQMRRSTLDRVSASATLVGASLPRYRRARPNGRRRHRLKSSRSLCRVCVEGNLLHKYFRPREFCAALAFSG